MCVVNRLCTALRFAAVLGEPHTNHTKYRTNELLASEHTTAGIFRVFRVLGSERFRAWIARMREWNESKSKYRVQVFFIVVLLLLSIAFNVDKRQGNFENDFFLVEKKQVAKVETGSEEAWLRYFKCK